MDDLQQYSLDQMTNVSTLVPMTKSTLSGRQNLNQILMHIVNNAPPDESRNQFSGQATPDSFNDSDGGPISPSSIKNNKQAIAQADFFLQRRQAARQKHLKDDQKNNKSRLDESFGRASHDLNNNLHHQISRTTIQGNTDLNDPREDPRDQLIISKDHALPRQQLRNKNVLAPSFQPLHATQKLQKGRLSLLARANTQLAHPSIGGDDDLRRSNNNNTPTYHKSTIREKKSSIINVEVIFDTKAYKAAQQPVTSRCSMRDPRILTLRNEKQNITPTRISNEQERARETVRNQIRSNQTSAESPQRSGSLRRNRVKGTQAADSTPRIYNNDKISDNNSNNVVILEKYLEDEEAYDEVLDMEVDSKPKRKTITVEMGKQKPLHNLKSDPLKQQEVRHTYFKNEQNAYKPLAKYIYDDFGTMVNKHRKQKKPTVQKYINKVEKDLKNQIRNQRDFLLKVMGDRLKHDYSKDEYATLTPRSKSPISSPNKNGENEIFTLCSGSKQVKPFSVGLAQNNHVNISKNKSVHRSSSNESSSQGRIRESDQSGKVIKELFEKMQWAKVDIQKQPRQQSRFSEPGIPIYNHHSDLKDVTMTDSMMANATRQNSAEQQQPSMIILESVSKGSNINAQNRRIVKNSQVPRAVNPCDHLLQSDVIKGILRRQVSSQDELDQSQSLEENIMLKMREQSLLSNTYNLSQPQSPSSIRRRPDSIIQSSFFVSPNTQNSAVPFDTFGGANERKTLLKDKNRHSGQQSSIRSKKDDFNQPSQKQLQHRVNRKSPSPFFSKHQHANQESKESEPISYTSRMIVKGVAPPQIYKKDSLTLGQSSTLPVSPRSSRSKDAKTQANEDLIFYDVEMETRENQEESKDNLATRQEGMRVLQSYVLEEKLREAQGIDKEIQEVNRSTPLQQVMKNNPSPEISDQNFQTVTQNSEENEDENGVVESSNQNDDEDEDVSELTSLISQKIQPTQAQVILVAKTGVFSTSTLLQGDGSSKSKVVEIPKQSTKESNIFKSRLIQESASTRAVNENARFNLQKVQIVQQQQSQGKIKKRKVHELKLRQASVLAHPNPSTQYQISLPDSEMREGQRSGEGRDCLVRFMFTRVGHFVYECKINLSKIVNSLSSHELTAEDFQQRCLILVVEKLTQKHKIKIDIRDLLMCDLEGQVIHSIIDWLQKPLEAQLSHFIILIVEKSKDIGEALKFFDLNRPLSVSGSELAELMKPVQEVLALFKDDQNKSGTASNYIYTNQSFAGLRNSSQASPMHHVDHDLLVQGRRSTLQSKNKLDKIKVVTLSQEGKVLGEDSLFSCSQQRSFGDEAFMISNQQSRYSKRGGTTTRNQLAQTYNNNGVRQQASHVNVMEESPGHNLIGTKFYEQIKKQREGSKVHTEGGYRKFSQMAEKSSSKQAQCSDFSNYVCQELLSHIEKPNKKMTFEQKMSNPASAHVVHARMSAATTQRNAVTSMENPDTGTQQHVIKRFFEDYYKRPIAMSAMRQSFSDQHQPEVVPMPSTADKVINNGTGLIPSDSLFSAYLRGDLPQVMRVQTGVPQSLREYTQNGSNISHNLDLRLSTLTQPYSKHQSLRQSVDATVTNSTKVSTSKRSSRQNPDMLSTWNGPRNSIMTAAPAVKMRNTTIYKKLGSNMNNELYDIESTIKTSRGNRTSVAPLQTRFSLPVESSTRKSSLQQKRPQESQGDEFVSARSIKVPLQHKFYMKKNEDFNKMKNLFLANCLKLKDGEAGLTEKLEQSMSNRIKAFRSGLNILAPIKQGNRTTRMMKRTTTL